jgi:hypothetical protein
VTSRLDSVSSEECLRFSGLLALYEKKTRVRNTTRLGDLVRKTYVTERAPDTGEDAGLFTLENTHRMSPLTRQ